MFSPFKNKKGQFLSIHDVKYNYIKQLEDIDEGYKVEFKETFDTNVKKKIPAIMTSFANSEGGWLIIGINDDSHQPVFIPKEKGDYSQKISLILKNNKVSPLPRFETKFIYNPSNRKEGILLVYIYEGNFTPYVSNGTIYIRNGSNKEPIRSDRATIEFLYKKSENFQKDIEKFCERTIEYPKDMGIIGNRKISYPICNVYIKNINTNADIKKVFIKNEEEIIKLFKHLYDGIAWKSVQKILGGLVFRKNRLDPSSSIVTTNFELLNDFSCKISFPLLWSNEKNKEKAKQHLSDIAKFKWDQNIPIIDGTLGCDSLLVGMDSFIELLKKFTLDLNDFAICFEIENGGNAILFFDTPLYDKYIQEFGVCIHNRMKTKSEILYFQNFEDIILEQLSSQIVIEFFMTAFGMFQDKCCDIVNDTLKRE